MHSPLSTVEIKPKSTHKYSIIWMHGLGADGHDFEGLVPELHLNAQDHIHFIFPNAPIQAVTINGGVEMRAWYDILERTLERKVDINGIHESVDSINTLINKEIEKGIQAEHIILAGFSQGGVIALHAGLNFIQNLGGIIALSTYFPTINELTTTKNTPIFMAHGVADPVVDIKRAEQSRELLLQLGYSVEWHAYPMQHTLHWQEIIDIGNWFRKVLA